MICSVCIATYKRPEKLKECLSSIAQLKLSENIHIEVILVDNDRKKSAEPVYKWFQNHFKIHINYTNEPEQNIALARNRAINNAKGKYILFIDDDEIATPDWLMNLVHCIETHHADAVFGKVQFTFDQTIPQYIQECYLYLGDQDLQTGRKATLFKTNNVIIKSSLLKSMTIIFDPRYGITGGSDSQLFSRLEIQGAKFIECAEAVTIEYSPPQRSNKKWLMKRAMRGGNNHTRILIELAPKGTIKLRIQQFAIGSVYMMMGSLLSIVYCWNKTQSLNWQCKAAANYGKITALFMKYPEEYRDKNN